MFYQRVLASQDRPLCPPRYRQRSQSRKNQSLFLQYVPDREHREKVNEVIDAEAVLGVAGELLMSISQNERERAIFRSRSCQTMRLLFSPIPILKTGEIKEETGEYPLWSKRVYLGKNCYLHPIISYQQSF